MIGKTVVAVAASLLLLSQVQAQTNQGSAQGATSGPAVGISTHLNSPQAGPLETPHQRDAVRDQSQSMRDNANQNAPGKNDEGGLLDRVRPALGSSLGSRGKGLKLMVAGVGF